MVRIFPSKVAGETETCYVFEMRTIELEILENCFWRNYFSEIQTRISGTELESTLSLLSNLFYTSPLPPNPPPPTTTTQSCHVFFNFDILMS